MIVPRSKLLFWTAATVLPFALLGAVVPGAAAVSLVIIGGFAIMAVADAWGAPSRLAGISLTLPPVIRMAKGRASSVEISFRNERQTQKPLRLALAWPVGFQMDTEEQETILPAQSEWSRFVWPCTPQKRGHHPLQLARIETSSHLGFWAVRKTLPVAAEIRVYPNLLHERKNLAALFLNRGTFGIHAQRQVGKGRDFEKLREYAPGDGYDEIHWKATARRGKPITKVFQVEKTQEVYVILDASRLSARAAASETETASTLERFITSALVLGLAAEQQGDRFGLLTFTDQVDKFVRAQTGRAHYSACRDALYTVEPKIVTPDFDELCTFIRLRLRRRALLVFLTALDDPAIAESFVRNIELIRRQHLVLVNMLQPPGVGPLFSQPQVQGMDDLYQHLGGHLRWQNLRELQKTLQRRGVQFSLPASEHLSAELVTRYLSIKQRQLL